MIQAHGWKFDVKIWNGNEVTLWYKYVIKYNDKKIKKWKHWITNKSAGGDWVWGMRREDCLWSRWNCTGCRWTSPTSSTSSTSSLYKIIEESEEKQMIFEVADAWESPTHIFHQQCFNQTQKMAFFILRSWPKPSDCCLLHGAHQVHQICKAGRWHHIVQLWWYKMVHFMIILQSTKVNMNTTFPFFQFASSRKCEKIKCGSF